MGVDRGGNGKPPGAAAAGTGQTARSSTQISRQALARACREIRGLLPGGSRVAGRVGVGVGVSEFVGGTRKDGLRCVRTAYRSRSREPPTQAATRSPNTLTLALTLAGPRRTGRPVAHVGQPREHGAQAVEKHEQGQYFRLGCEVEHHHALQSSRCLACLAAGAAEAAQPVGPLAAGGFGDAKVGAEQRTAELVLEAGIAARKPAAKSVAKTQGFAGDLVGVESLVVEGGKCGGHGLVIGRA